MQDLNQTTRCFPRTLLEAFPTHYNQAIEAPPKEESFGILGYAGLILWLLIAALLCV
jgi:hypothetical protein